MISRTSQWEKEQAPCNGAYKAPYTRIDERTVNNPAKIRAMQGQPSSWWYADGTNHRVERGHIKRDFSDEAWFLDIETLEQLLALQAKYGSLILQVCQFNTTIPQIEIYDDYRE